MDVDADGKVLRVQSGQSCTAAWLQSDGVATLRLCHLATLQLRHSEKAS